jgi:hypothetical protein
MSKSRNHFFLQARRHKCATAADGALKLGQMIFMNPSAEILSGGSSPALLLRGTVSSLLFKTQVPAAVSCQFESSDLISRVPREGNVEREPHSSHKLIAEDKSWRGGRFFNRAVDPAKLSAKGLTG